MAGLDDDAPDDEPTGPRPDPANRAWVHPAELQAFRPAPTSTAAPPRPREWVIGVVSAVAAVAATVLVLVAFGALGGRDRATIPPPAVTNPSSPIDYVDAQRVRVSAGPTIVTVSTDAPTADGSPAVGSGVVIRTDRVLTSAHLLVGASKVTVSTKGGATITAQVSGVDPATDLGLLVASGVGDQLATPYTLGEAGVGDVVVALGAGKANTGWVDINVVQEQNWLVTSGAAAIAGLLATGTDTTPATSGGGLFDTQGRLIGVLVSPPGVARTGLAIPVDVALDVADQLERTKKVAHGSVGVVFGADASGGTAGATVAGVVPDGPAAKADPPLQAGDVIVHAGDRSVSGMQDMVAAARRLHPSDPLELVFVRGGRTMRTRMQLAAASDGLDSPFGSPAS